MARKAHTDRRPAVDDPEGRIRVVLEVADGEPMPAVRLEALRKYHDHLAANLSFPFEGRLADPVGPHRDTRSLLRVIRLLDVDSYGPEEMYGLIRKAEQDGERIELPPGPNRRFGRQPQPAVAGGLPVLDAELGLTCQGQGMNHGSSLISCRHSSSVCPWNSSTHCPVCRMNDRSNLPPAAGRSLAKRDSNVGEMALGPGQA
jgi:hypothetical protein